MMGISYFTVHGVQIEVSTTRCRCGWSEKLEFGILLYLGRAGETLEKSQQASLSSWLLALGLAA